MPSRTTRSTRTPSRLVNAVSFLYRAPLGPELKSLLLRQHLKSDPTEPPETPREDPEGGGDEEAGGEAEAEGEGEAQKLQRPTSASSSRLKPKLPPLEKPADD